jgi:hypothetical protein
MTFATYFNPGISLQGGSGSGGGTPGGSTTQIQYNNAGAFAGASGLTTNGTNLTLGSASQLLWSTDLILVRDDANKLALRNGTTAQTFNVYETFTNASNYSRLSLSYTASNDYGITADKAGTGTFRSLTITTYGNATATFESDTLKIPSNGRFALCSTATSRGSADVILARDAANTLALRNGASAQEFRVYENTTGTIYKALLGNRQLIKIAGAAFDDGAGASAGTLTNAPAVGNPTKWIPIDDNGTTRHIPAW